MKNKNNNLFRKYYLSQDLSIDARLINIFCSIGTVGALTVFITRIIIGALPVSIIIAFLVFFTMLIALYLSNRFHNYIFCKRLIIIFVCFILFPLYFFFSGGTGRSAEYYLLLSIVIICLFEYGLGSIIFSTIEFFIIIALHCFYYLYPEFIIRLSGGAEFLQKLGFVD
jgi:hypothetical protein